MLHGLPRRFAPRNDENAKRAPYFAAAFFLGAAFFLAGAFLRFFLAGPFAARASINSIACAASTSSGFTSLGMVAFVVPSVT